MINKVIDLLPRYYLKVGKTEDLGLLCRWLKNISSIIKFDPSYFLHTWSTASAEYNKDRNDEKWAEYKGRIEKSSRSVMQCLIRHIPKRKKSKKKIARPSFNMEGLMISC